MIRFIAISVIVVLAITFVVTFILNKRTKAPEVNNKVSREQCSGCKNLECKMRGDIHD